ncbi:hypothetical protein BDV33DRAFT_185152 [Aspergillus novoparasiticus]|uniref:Uncharacterized protein n=1 Tax=Aspergillus novoparasiticus TaxID=986946 RepID=A0A5N6E9Z3_9EURO|nr:hypothetical protein BDV33DRAFT_185152 [Aspergillus novoparasiticus]
MDCIRSLDLLVKRILALYGATSDLAVRGTAEDNFNFCNTLMLCPGPALAMHCCGPSLEHRPGFVCSDQK